MAIDNLRSDAKRARHIDGGSPARDTVQISGEAHARAARGGTADDIPSGTITAGRLTELRRRIIEHVHDYDSMADEVMRRIADAGDLD